MEPIKIDITILSPVQKVWDLFIEPQHIMKWNFAHESWHCPKAENDFQVGGKLKTRMEAKDGSFGFNFTGLFDEITPKKVIKYHLDDGRKVVVTFVEEDSNTVKMLQSFEPEKENLRDMQRDGWYAIMNNFHKYVENLKDDL